MRRAVLITGEHRSGTTLLAELLDAQPLATVLADFLHIGRYATALGGLALDQGLDESAKAELLRLFARDNDTTGRTLAVEAGDFATLGEFYLHVLDAVADDGDLLVGHKSTRAYSVAAPLLRQVPDLRVVVAVRDPRSAFVSELARLETSAFMPLVTKWRECADFVVGVTAEPDLRARVAVVRFEELLSAPEAALRPLAAFLGVERIDAGQLGRTGGGRSGNSSFGPIEGGRIDASPRDRWRQNTRLSACVARMLAPEMAAMGYSASENEDEEARVQNLSKRLTDERARAATTPSVRGRTAGLAYERLEQFVASAVVEPPADDLEHHLSAVPDSAGSEVADRYQAALETAGHRPLLRHLYGEELLYASSVDPRTGRERTAFSRGHADLLSVQKRGLHLHEAKRSAVDITDRLLATLLEDGDFDRPPRRVLEIGGAWGATMSHVFARFDPEEYQNYEIDPDYSRWAEQEFGARAMPVDGETLSSTATGSIDLAIANNVLQFVPPIKVWSYLEELARVTAVGGVVLFGVVVADDLTAADRRQLLREHFPRRAFSLVPMSFVHASFPAAEFEDRSHDLQRHGLQKLRYFLFRRHAPAGVLPPAL